MEAQGKFTPITGIALFTLIMILAFTISQFVQVVFMLPYIDLQEYIRTEGQMDLFSAIPPASLLLMLGVSSLVMFVGGPWLYLRFAGKTVQSLNDNRRISLNSFLLVGVLVIAFMPLNSWIFEWNSKIPFPQYIIDLEKQMELTTKAITRFDSVFEFILGLVVIAVLAGVGEELTFRGIFQNLFRKLFNNPHAGIWAAAFVFSTIHFQFLGFFPRLFLGAMFGYIYYWSGNLILAMYAHFINNGFTVLMVHLYNLKLVETDFESTESMPWYMVLFSLLTCAGILVILNRSFKQANTDQWLEN